MNGVKSTFVKPSPLAKESEALAIVRHGSFLESVSSKAGSLNLIVSNKGLEMIEGTLKVHERLTLLPSDDPNHNESYYILQGSLLNDAGLRLEAGDSCSTEGLREPFIFTAESFTRFLYISSKPVFHEISHEMQDLLQLAVDIELKDGYTADHCLRLQRLSYATGQELGLDAHRLHHLDYGAYLHDVGKIKIPLEILQKPAKLTDDEYEIIKGHPSYGYDMLKSTFMKEAGRIVEQHHERLDGSGYPYALSKENILIEAYIVAVADTYDAMTTDRPYRKALDPQIAFDELDKYSNIHYPREVVTAFRSAVKRIELGN